MREYYKEKLANLREIVRGMVILLITLLSGDTYLVVKLLISGFKWIEFLLVTVGYVLSILIFLFLIQLCKYIFNETEKLKEL